jgi:hypothetical protein
MVSHGVYIGLPAAAVVSDPAAAQDLTRPATFGGGSEAAVQAVEVSMANRGGFTRRRFVASAALLAAGGAAPLRALAGLSASGATPLLQPFGYRDVTLHSALHEQQLDTHLQLLMSLDEDSLLKPFRQMVGQSAPGEALGGWYNYDTEHYGIDGAYAPSATFGQWVSALARMYAIRGTPGIRDKVLRLNRLYAQTIDGQYYENNRFPAYCYDKLVCGLIDSHTFAHDADAFRILEHTTDTALPHLPGRAIPNGTGWRPGKDESYNSDESYTVPENLFLAYQRGAGERYRTMARAYLDEAYFPGAKAAVISRAATPTVMSTR